MGKKDDPGNDKSNLGNGDDIFRRLAQAADMLADLALSTGTGLGKSGENSVVDGNKLDDIALHIGRAMVAPFAVANMPPSIDRQTYKTQLARVAACVAGLGYGSRVTCELKESRWFHGGLDLVITAPGIEREARVIYAHPDWRTGLYRGPMATHFELSVTGFRNGLGDLLAGKESSDPAEIAAAAGAWLDSEFQAPDSPLSSLRSSDIQHLRPVAEATSRVLAGDRGPFGEGVLPPTDHLLLSAMTAEGADAYEADLQHLNLPVLLAFAPRDEKGRLRTDTTIALVRYPLQVPDLSRKHPWLVARTPKRRRDPQVLTLSLKLLDGTIFPHRWDCARWLWDLRHTNTVEDERWGFSDLNITRLGMEERAENLAHFERVRAGPDVRPADRIALSILLQDEGRIEDAIELSGIDLAPDVRNVLHGRWVQYNALELAKPWQATLVEAIRSMALWRLGLVVSTAAAEKAGGKSVRRPKPIRLRLFALPHQTQTRKTSVMLVGGTDSVPLRIELEATGSNYRLPEVLWKRPLDPDPRRFGLLGEMVSDCQQVRNIGPART